jgi:hypothetical protein
MDVEQARSVVSANIRAKIFCLLFVIWEYERLKLSSLGKQFATIDDVILSKWEILDSRQTCYIPVSDDITGYELVGRTVALKQMRICAEFILEGLKRKESTSKIYLQMR